MLDALRVMNTETGMNTLCRARHIVYHCLSEVQPVCPSRSITHPIHVLNSLLVSQNQYETS